MGEATGYTRGYSVAKKDFYDSRYNAGYNDGYEKGKYFFYNSRYDQGYAQGKTDFYDSRYDQGYSKGSSNEKAKCCFPGTASVKLFSRPDLDMTGVFEVYKSNLNQVQRVQDFSHRDGPLSPFKTHLPTNYTDSEKQRQFTEMMGFIHIDTDVVEEYLQLHHEYGLIRLSGPHLIFKLEAAAAAYTRLASCFCNFLSLRASETFMEEMNCNGNISLYMTAVPAATVIVGDLLIYSRQKINALERGGVCLSQVTVIDRVFVQGAYAPLTTSGHLLVDGLLVSCYVDPFILDPSNHSHSLPMKQTVYHSTAHLFYAPLRWLWHLQQSYILAVLVDTITSTSGTQRYSLDYFPLAVSYFPPNGEFHWYARFLLFISPVYVSLTRFLHQFTDA